MRIIKLCVVFFAISLVTISSATTRFNAATFNLRNSHNDDAKHGNGWAVRCPVIAQIIQFHDFDIFGTQEGYVEQLQDLKALLPGYEYIGVARDDGKLEGEHSAIFYRTDKFECLEHGDFWLSEDPSKPGLGWDAVCVRICSWGHFRCKDTGFEFLFFNLHMDHVGKKARVESAKLVQEKMKEFGSELPRILTGDFNVDQTHDSYKALVSTGVLKDAYEAADMRFALNGTFNAFKAEDFTTSRIDHVFVSPAFHVLKYGVLTDTYRTPKQNNAAHTEANAPQEIKFQQYEIRTPSDHYPVKVVLEYDK